MINLLIALKRNVRRVSLPFIWMLSAMPSRWKVQPQATFGQYHRVLPVKNRAFFSSSKRQPACWLVWLLVAVFGSVAQGQDPTQGGQPTKVSIMPPSPTAAALGKYGDIPVSLYTGTPTISIPIWEVKGKQVSLPISMSYHASGVKVEEVASWVGMGWSLNAGGVITRTVKGLPDEHGNGYSGYNRIGKKVIDYNNNRYNAAQKYEFDRNVAEGIWDAEPDMFFFNFAGKSGKMVFDADGKAVLIPAQKMKVEGRIDGEGFTITTEDGTQYFFTTTETSERIDQCDFNPLPSYVSSWYLTLVKAPNGEMIFLGYQSARVFQEIFPTETAYQLTTPNQDCGPIPNYSCKTIIETQVQRLKSIACNGTVLTFQANTPRTDLPLLSNDKLLDNIEISHNNVLVNKFALSYGVFGCNRPRLDRLQELGKANAPKPAYRFTYYEPERVPCITSKAQDHWGYMNNNSTGTLVPEGGFYNPLGDYIPLPGANRSPHEEMGKTGILTRMTYPTGSYTDFEFESHDYGYLGRQLVSDPILTPAEAFVQADPNLSGPVTMDFSVEREQVVTVTYAVNITQEIGFIPSDGEYVRMYKISGGGKPFSLAASFSNGGHIKDKRLITPGTYRIEAYSQNPATRTAINVAYQRLDGFTKAPRTGGLRIKTTTDYDGINSQNNVVRRYEYRMQTERDRSSGVLMAKPEYEYDYKRLINVGSSGVVEIECTYYTRTAASHHLGTTQGSHIGYRQVSVFQGNNGKSVYTFLSPWESSDAISFGFPFAIGTSYDFRRGLQIQAADFRQQDSLYLPLKRVRTQHTFDEKPANYRSVSGIKIGYVKKSLLLNPNFNTFSVQPYDHISAWVYPSQTIEQVYDQTDTTKSVVNQTDYYYDNPNHLQLTRTQTSNSQGSNLVTILKYPLDFSLPTPSGSAATALKAMQSQHIVSPVVEKQTWRKRSATDSTLVAAELTHYKSLSSGDVVPDTLLSLQVAQPLTLNTTATPTPSSFSPLRVNASGALVREGKYEERLQYEQYDAKGNIRQVRRADDVATTYLWGYHSTYPIAEIKNATYAEVVAVLGQAVIDELAGASTGTEAQVRQKLAPLRTDARLQKAQVSILTYQPLVGRTSATDAAGVTTYYEYDDFQRLKQVKDLNGNIVRQNIYHYKGQP